MINHKINIQIDPIEVNGQIEEVKETYQDFYNEFNIIYEEYKDINYQQYINEEKNIEEINQNLEKVLDLCEIYTQELKNKNSDAIYNTINISKNYNIEETKEIQKVSQTIANLISLKNYITYYNNQLQIWNAIYTQKIEEAENITKNLQKEINHNIAQLIENNEKSNMEITEFQYQIESRIKNKYLQATIDMKLLETFIQFKNITIKEKQEKINLALEDLAKQIENIKQTETIDYTVDILKNNIDWTIQLKQIIIKTKQTIKKHNYKYLNENLEKIGEKYKNQLECLLNGYLIPEKNNLQELLDIFHKNSKEKNKSELIKTIKKYYIDLEDLTLEIENLKELYN